MSEENFAPAGHDDEAVCSLRACKGAARRIGLGDLGRNVIGTLAECKEYVRRERTLTTRLGVDEGMVVSWQMMLAGG